MIYQLEIIVVKIKWCTAVGKCQVGC